MNQTVQSARIYLLRFCLQLSLVIRHTDMDLHRAKKCFSVEEVLQELTESSDQKKSREEEEKSSDDEDGLSDEESTTSNDENTSDDESTSDEDGTSEKESTSNEEDDFSDKEDEFSDDEFSYEEDEGDTDEEEEIVARLGSRAEDPEACKQPKKRPRLSNSSFFNYSSERNKRRKTSHLFDCSFGTSEDKDVFKPARTPGPQLTSTASYSPLQLFQLFISDSMLETVVANTNAYGVEHQLDEKPFINISLNDLYSYVTMLLFIGLSKCFSLRDFWRKTKIHHPDFPFKVMTLEKYSDIESTFHLSDPKTDAENDTKRETSAYDSLCKIKPMYLQLRDACKTNFHPHKNIAVNEWVIEKDNSWNKCLKYKANKVGYKLFGLSDALCGYTWDFFICKGTKPAAQSKGESYESVMTLMGEKLGGGYKLHIDSIHNSQKLIRDLQENNIKTCVPAPSNMKQINKFHGNTDTLLSNYTVTKKTTKWYRSLFYHFVNIAVVNAFSIHHQMAQMKNQKPMTHRGFREALIMELADFVSLNRNVPPCPPVHDLHLITYITPDGTNGQCRLCKQKTQIMCRKCDVALCLHPTRNCFRDWHLQKKCV